MSATTVRRLLAQQGLPRRARRALQHTSQRLRWQAEGPMLLWHGDVCHGPSLRVEGQVQPLRIHALMDDASRYHVAPHSSLLGRSPQAVFHGSPQQRLEVDEALLRQALTERVVRLVRKDSTLSLEGQHYELEAGHLAGQRVLVCYYLLDSSLQPWAEYGGRRYALRPVDPVLNGQRRRQALPPAQPPSRPTDFNPPQVLLDKAVGRKPSARGERKHGGHSSSLPSPPPPRLAWLTSLSPRLSSSVACCTTTAPISSSSPCGPMPPLPSRTWPPEL